MKKYAILVLMILFIVISTSGCTSNAQNKTYNANGISFTYLGTWDEIPVNQIDNKGAIPDIAAVGNYSNKETFVTVQSADADKSLEGYTNWNKALLENDSSVQNITLNSLTVDGVPATQLAYIYTFNSSYVKKESMTAFLENNKIYCVELSTPSKDYNNQQDNLNMILKSFHVQ